ncbi:retinitis pigmentosa 1-like 1 protein [Rhynchocyon petersi]
MNGSLRDAQAPSYRECLLPSAARTSSIIQVTPAKKITFFKRGDPRFSGVRLAVHQRAFKSFSALMDELSQRMPLSFGVRSVTTPRGLHCLSTLEQLEDGGCYLCSDKKPPQTPIGPGRQQERALTTQPLGDSESRSEDAGTPSSWKGPRVSRRIMLVKNTNPRFQRTVLLSHRNTRSLPAFLSKASDLLHFPVKQVFTPSGKKVDSLQGLLHGPLVLVCAGHESFRPPVIEESRRNGTETSSGLTSRNKNGSWGLKAKQSIIHSRSKSGNRSRRFSTMSERSGLSEAPVSLPHTCMSSALHKHFQDTPAHIGPLVADDDFEKKVHMNEDGSLSVEMKVRFHLPSEDTLLWSTGIRRASTLTTTSGGHPVLGEVDALHCVCEGSSEDFSESGVLGQRAYLQAEANEQDAGIHKAEEGSSRVSKQASRDPGSPSCGSLRSQYLPGIHSATVTPVMKRPNRVKSDDRQGSHCSHIDTSLVCGIHSSKIQTLWASQSQGRPRSTSGACLVCSRYCPTPPSADPSSKKHSSSSSSNSDVYRAADWGPGEGEQGERRFDGLSSLPLGSKSGATGGTVRTMMRSSPCPSSSFGPSPSPSPRGMSQWKIAGEEVSLEEQEEDGGMMPSALPRISPEAVICDWLSQIPEEPILMKYEMMDETSNVTEDDSQCTQEDPTDKHSEIGPEESAQAEEQPLEGETSETPELDGAPATDGASLKLEEDSSQKGAPRGVSETCEEVRASERTTVDHGVCKDILTSSIPASIHIMKTLISSKQGRPRSLPEVSDVVGRRLSDSACTLVTSLARLHFFDEDLGSPVSRVRFTDSPRFQMLLATLQSLWPQCDKLDLGLQEPKSGQALPGSVSHPVTEDFTPTSSSGVDVSSGSVGSGEGNAPCPVDCTPSPERVQMPLEMVQSTASHQKPDSSTSENAEELENQHQSCPAASSDSQAWACTTSQDKAGENEGEGQMEDNSPEQSVENTVQENLKVEQIQELDKELRKDHGSEEEFPEEERVPEQELPGDDTEDGEGTQEGTGMPEEDAGRDPDSEEDLYPAGLSGKTTGPSRNPSEGDAQTSEHLSSRAVEPSLKKPSRSAEAASEQTQATATQRAGDRSSSTAPRPPRDADPIWAFSLLKKMEKAFMAHLASATVALRARWGLLDHDLLDQLVAELHQDVGRRLQDSVKKEFGKIQSRAGGKEPRPPREALRRETSLQAEQRRRRLQGLRNLSAFAERTRTQGLLSLTLEDEPSLSAGLDTGLDGQADGEEFCPCKTCVRKKVSGASPSRGPVGAGSAPLVQSYDLRQILQKRKDGGANGGAPAGDQEQVGLGQLQEHPSRTGSVQGAEGGLEPGLGPSSQVDSGEEEEGSQKLSEAGDPELGETEGAGSQEGEEDPAAQTRDADIEDENDRKGERPEQGVSETEENVIEGPGSEDTLMSESSGGEDGDPGGEGKTADAGQFPEAEGQGQAESGSEQEEGRLSVSPGEASENCTPDQEEKLPCSPGPGDDTPHQEPVPQTGISSFIMSSLGNCSQVSQKGSEEEDSNGDTGSFADEPTEVTHPEKNVTGMSPDSSTSGPEEACSGPKTPDQKVDEDSALADGKVVKSLTFTNMVNKTGEFGQDDFDF